MKLHALITIVFVVCLSANTFAQNAPVKSTVKKNAAVTTKKTAETKGPSSLYQAEEPQVKVAIPTFYVIDDKPVSKEEYFNHLREKEKHSNKRPE